jgi:hypothetical protein
MSEILLDSVNYIVKDDDNSLYIHANIDNNGRLSLQTHQKKQSFMFWNSDPSVARKIAGLILKAVEKAEQIQVGGNIQ